MSDSRSVFVEVEGVRLRAVIDGPSTGSVTPVLLLHGFTGGAESMEGVALPLSKLRPVVRLELVGHGESDAPTAVAPYAMAVCVEQVVAAVADLGLRRPHLVGYSMGGRTALSCAVAHPTVFESLVLIGATAGIADEALRRERIASDEALADRIESEGLEAFVDAWMALPIFASQARLGERALARARAERMRNRPHGLAHSLRGMGAGAQAPLHDRLACYAGPTLLVVGEEDAKFRAIAEDLETRLANARTAVIPEAGHAAHLEAPDSFARLLRDFLDEVDGRRNAR